MPKTKDAFALRGFDEKRILQRPWFKKFNLPVDDDIKIRDCFFKNVIDLRDASKRLSKIERLNDYAKSYILHLKKHEARLEKIMRVYANKYISLKDEKIKAKYQRALNLKAFYFELYWNIVATSFYKEIVAISVATGSVLFLSRCHKVFRSRLKALRKAKSITQLQLAESVGLKSANAIATYENGKAEPSLPTLFRLATELDCSVDWLLGLD